MKGSTLAAGPMSTNVALHSSPKSPCSSDDVVRSNKEDPGDQLIRLEPCYCAFVRFRDSSVLNLLMRSKRVLRWKVRKAVLRTSVLALSSLAFPSALVDMNCHSLGIVQGWTEKMNYDMRRYCSHDCGWMGLEETCRLFRVLGSVSRVQMHGTLFNGCIRVLMWAHTVVIGHGYVLCEKKISSWIEHYKFSIAALDLVHPLPLSRFSNYDLLTTGPETKTVEYVVIYPSGITSAS
jgi:hypothetical protein